jgi:putative protease
MSTQLSSSTFILIFEYNGGIGGIERIGHANGGNSEHETIRRCLQMGEETAKEKELIGKVTHFFDKISVAAIELSDVVKVGDTISIEGTTTSFEQTIESMQIHNTVVEDAGAGDSVGLKVKERVKVGDNVYRIS